MGLHIQRKWHQNIKDALHACVHWNSIHNRYTIVNPNRCSTDGQIEKDAVYIHTGISCNHEEIFIKVNETRKDKYYTWDFFQKIDKNINIITRGWEVWEEATVFEQYTEYACKYKAININKNVKKAETNEKLAEINPLTSF